MDFERMIEVLQRIFEEMVLEPLDIGLNLETDNSSIEMIAIKRLAKSDVLRRKGIEMEGGVLHNEWVSRTDPNLRNTNNQTQTFITGAAKRIFPYLESYKFGELTKNIFTLLVPVSIPVANYRYLLRNIPSHYYSDEKTLLLEEEIMEYQQNGLINLDLSVAIEGQDRVQFGTKSYVPEDQRRVYLEYKYLNFQYDHLIILKLKNKFEYICLTITNSLAQELNVQEGFYEKLPNRAATIVPFEHYISTDVDDEKIEKLLFLLGKNPNLILYGPPGTGKTYFVNKLKEHFTYNEMITFHQSYSYEEFIEGITLDIDEESGNGRYRPKDGIFKQICNEAVKLENQDKSYVLFIDEINRGNITKIFGELITLIEKDKRNPNVKVKLTYSKDDFYVPSNVFLVGTMNTTDRSISLIDSALRRRFAFYEILPDFSDFESSGIDKKIKISIEAIKKINDFIAKDIDKNHQIGQGYFYDLLSVGGEELEENILYVWLYQIIPLLQEYFYSDSSEIAEVLGNFVIYDNDQLSFDINYSLEYSQLETQLKIIGKYNDLELTDNAGEEEDNN